MAAVGAAATALGVSLALTLGGTAPGASGGSGPGASGGTGPRAVHVNLAAWSVNTTSSGVVDVTIRQLDDPQLLGQTLAAAGVRALITSGAICFPRDTTVPASVDEEAIIQRPFVPHPSGPTGFAIFGINPAAIPAGDEVDIGVQKDVQYAVGVIAASSRLSCMVVPNYGGPPPPPSPKPAPKPAAAYIVYPPAR